jgi:hypothetical protein
MLNYILFLFAGLSYLHVEAKGVVFPDVPYSYVKVYYYNIENASQKPITHIFAQQDGWAKDAQLASEKLTTEDVKKISTILSKGIDGLQLGLSGCFIPHHGIVYFNEKDQPVASISICLECEGARFWTVNKGVYRTKATKLNEKVVSKQFINLKQLFESKNVVVLDNPNEYVKLGNADKTNNISSITIQDSVYVAKLIGEGTIAACKMWSKENNFIQDTLKKYTAGGDKYEFIKLTNGTNTLLFDGKDARSKLADGTLRTSSVRLANGIKVGDSLNDVMNTFLVYDGVSNPQTISVEGDFYKIVYTFESEILISIVIGYK